MDRRQVLQTMGFGAALAGLSRPVRASGAEVQVWLDMAEAIASGRFDPGRDAVGLRGGVPPLSWRQSLPAQRQPDGRWLVRLRLAWRPSQPLPYKAKIDREGAPGEGWEPGANHTLPLRGDGQPTVVERAFGSVATPPPLQRSGRIERLAGGLQLWLPPGYDEAGRTRYPLLVLLDGQNQFDAAAAGAEWRMDEAAEAGVRAGTLRPFLMLALPSGETRRHDYSPFGPEGGGPAFARRLVQETLPRLGERWRLQPGRGQHAVGGSSLGALMALWLALTEPATFGSALVVSPAVWWQQRRIVQAVREHRGPVPRLWLDVGLAEGDEAVADARTLHQAVAARGWPHAWHEVPDAGHDELAWGERSAAMLAFLHGR
jgi:enterochelin esterase-like enzyme